MILYNILFKIIQRIGDSIEFVFVIPLLFIVTSF